VKKVHHFARCTLAGDLKPVERIHSVLDILEGVNRRGKPAGQMLFQRPSNLPGPRANRRVEA
jgi:hypothetical protein